MSFENYATAKSLALRADTWVCDVASQLENTQSLETAMLRLSNIAGSAASVLNRRTTLGVFGASQAGKSYLVNTMASGGAELVCHWGNDQIEFMTHVNPSGGDKEATGAVTRFTHDKIDTVAGFPVCIRVLKTCEMALILCNSFYKDFTSTSNELFQKLDENLNAEFYEPFFRETEQDPGNLAEPSMVGRAVSRADVVFMSDYVREHASGRLASLSPDDSFWILLRDLAPKLNSKGLARAFSLLWGRIPVLTELFEKLVNELFKLEGASTVFTRIDAFVETNARGALVQHSDGTVLSISTLSGIYSNPRRITVAFKAGDEVKTADLGFAILTAAVLELQFPLEGQSKLKDFDVLDFPGARSRRADNAADFIQKGCTEETRSNSFEFLRRGKVAYLFDRYAKDKEVDVLLFCINSSMQGEVSSLVEILNGWIAQNIGATPEDRAKFKDIPLIGIMTRFDQQMEKVLKNAVGGRPMEACKTMTTAFEHFKNCSWLNEWTPGQMHKRFFLVRRPAMGAPFKLENGRESGLMDEYAPYLEELKADFSRDPGTAHLYAGTAQALEDVLKLDDGGAGAVLSLISKEFTNYQESRRRIIDNVKKLINAACEELSKYQSGSGTQAVARALERGRKIACAFIQCSRIIPLFGAVRECLEIGSDRLEELYSKDYSYGNNAWRFAHQCVCLLVTQLRDLKNGAMLAAITKQLVKSWACQRENIKCQPDTKLRYSFFYDENSGDFLGADGRDLTARFAVLADSYAEEIEKALAGCGIEQKIVDALEVNEHLADFDRLVKIQCRVAMRILSSFLLYLGFDEEERLSPEYSRMNICGGEDIQGPLFEEHLTVTEEMHQDGYPIATLPELTQAYIDNCGDELLVEHLTALVNRMVGKNLNASCRYKFSADQGDELNAILDGFNEVLQA